MDKFCCFLIVLVATNLSMWAAILVVPQLDRSEWFVNEVFGRVLAAGAASAIVGIIYTGYISIWRSRESVEVATCCFLSAVALIVNLIGVLAFLP
jgi:hypothetical protein